MRIFSSMCNGPVDNETGSGAISPGKDDNRVRLQVKRSQAKGSNASHKEMQNVVKPAVAVSSLSKVVAPADVGTPNTAPLLGCPDVVSEWTIQPKQAENASIDDTVASATVALDFDDVDTRPFDGVSKETVLTGERLMETSSSLNAVNSSVSLSVDEAGSVDDDALRENAVMKDNTEKYFKMIFSHFSVAWISRTIAECLDCFGVFEQVKSLLSKTETLSIIRTHASAIILNMFQLVSTISVHVPARRHQN